MPTLFSTLRNGQKLTQPMGDPQKTVPLCPLPGNNDICAPFRELTIPFSG
jgi:hypothetical protein